MAVESPEYEIRLVKQKELRDVFEIWRKSNLPGGTHAIETFYKFDPEGIYVAVTKDGTVIGSCAGIFHHDDLAVIAMYVVTPAFRGRGIGRKIWNKVLERIGNRNVGLNPVPNMLEKYRDEFPIQSRWLSVDYVAEEIPTSKMIADIPDLKVNIIHSRDTDRMIAAADYDADILNFHRGSLVPLLCHEKDSITVIATRSFDGIVCGYGAIKKNVQGNALVGPLYADNSCIAELILYHLVKLFPIAKKKGVTLTIIDCNKGAMTMVERLGFVKQQGTARLYKNKEVDVQFDKIFAQFNRYFTVF